MKRLWNATKKWASENSKAIGSGVGSIASFVFLNLTNHDLDAEAKALIILVVTYAVTWLAPANKVKEPIGGTES